MPSDSNHELQSKLEALFDEHQWMEPDILRRVVQRVRQEKTNHSKRRAHIVKIADRFNDALAPYTACRKGCSHCCHMPTMIYREEAQSLSQASGRIMATIEPRLVHRALETAAKFSGQPCPFLATDGSCSVYDARPLICRLHHSLNENSNDCHVGPSGSTGLVARYDVDVIEMPYHQLMFEKNPPEAWASIHEFFPHS